MCLKVTKQGVAKLAKMKASGRKFVYGYGVKEITPTFTEVYNYYKHDMLFNKGYSLAVGKPELILVDYLLSTGFHLTFLKKDLKDFIKWASSFDNVRKVCVIRVKVAVKDIMAIGEHDGAGCFPENPTGAFLAAAVTWDGRFNLKTTNGLISKKVLTFQ